MNVQASRDRIQVGAPAELATAPRVVVALGAAPDGLPWLLSVDRSRELSTLFSVVPKVFGLTRREELPPRVRHALEHEVAAGLMGVHDVALDGAGAGAGAGAALRGFVARKKLKHLLGPTLLAQLLDRRAPLATAVEAPDARDVSTNVGAMAAREQDEAMLDAVDRALDELRAKRHLLLALETGAAYACSVRSEDRALRVPSAPLRPLAFESLAAFGDVQVTAWSVAGTWVAPLADRAAVHAALLRVHQAHGGWVRFEIARAHILAKLVEIARGVDALHRGERVHADLAPGNLLVCADGARAFDGLEIEAGTPAPAATFEWAAPEQIVGHPVDPRTDVYALARMATAVLGGVVFGEQTEYVVPIGGDRARRVKLLKGEGVFLDVSQGGRDRAWQRAWQDLLGRAIHFDRARRPATGGAFADELAALLERYPAPERVVLEPAFGEVVAVEGDDGLAFAHVAAD